MSSPSCAHRMTTPQTYSRAYRTISHTFASADRVSNCVDPAAATGTVKRPLPSSLSAPAVAFQLFWSPTTWCFGGLVATTW